MIRTTCSSFWVGGSSRRNTACYKITQITLIVDRKTDASLALNRLYVLFCFYHQPAQIDFDLLEMMRSMGSKETFTATCTKKSFIHTESQPLNVEAQELGFYVSAIFFEKKTISISKSGQVNFIQDQSSARPLKSHVGEQQRLRGTPWCAPNWRSLRWPWFIARQSDVLTSSLINWSTLLSQRGRVRL